MAERKLLTAEEIRQALERLPRWQFAKGKLHREYEFQDFVHAFGFMATAAIAIEKLNHHPDWSNVWNKVVVDLWTHDAKGVTERDVNLALLLEGLSTKLQ